MSGLANILVPLMVWDSPSHGVWVNLLQDSSGTIVFDDPVGFWLGYELGSHLWYLLGSETWPPVGLQLIIYIPHGPKLRYPDLVGYLLWDTLAVPPSGYCPNFPPSPSGTWLASPSQATIAANFLGHDPLFLGGVGPVGTSVRPNVMRK